MGIQPSRLCRRVRGSLVPAGIGVLDSRLRKCGCRLCTRVCIWFSQGFTHWGGRGGDGVERGDRMRLAGRGCGTVDGRGVSWVACLRRRWMVMPPRWWPGGVGGRRLGLSAPARRWSWRTTFAHYVRCRADESDCRQPPDPSCWSGVAGLARLFGSTARYHSHEPHQGRFSPITSQASRNTVREQESLHAFEP